MGKAFDRVIDAFHAAGLRVHMQGSWSASAQAPGHSTADQSVSIRSEEGRALVWSHSDPTDDVLAAVGLQVSDLFDEPKGITYSYSDGRKVIRSPGKKFSQAGNTKGNALYRAERLSQASVVYMVEGEQDVHSMEALGAAATCTAMGAGKAHLFDLSPLYGKTVRIVRDMDDPGLQHAQQVAQLLIGKAEVELFEPIVGKDATDHFAAGHGRDDLVQVSFPAAPEPVDEEFERAVADVRRQERVRATAKRRDAEDLAAQVGSRLNPQTLEEIQARPIIHDWLVPGLLERRDRLVMTGAEGAGKSWLMRQIVICLASGIHPFNVHEQIEPLRALVVDAENSEDQWNRGTQYVTHTVMHYGSDPRQRVIVNAGVRIDLSQASGVNEVRAQIDRYKPDVLYIGPLYKLVPKGITNDDDAAPLIETLDGLRESGLALIMEAHAGKGKALGGERDLSPRGSSALLGWPEFGFGLRPMDEDPSIAHLTRWRSDREKRDWPTRIRRGIQGELPWMRADITY